MSNHPPPPEKDAADTEPPSSRAEDARQQPAADHPRDRGGPRVYSLAELNLLRMAGLEGDDNGVNLRAALGLAAAKESSKQQQLLAVLERLKVPPAVTTCRLSRSLQQDKQHVVQQLDSYLRERYPQYHDDITVTAHPVLPDVLCIERRVEGSENETGFSRLYRCRGPPPPDDAAATAATAAARLEDNDDDGESQGSSGWSGCSGHKIVIVDRLCGEAVLRGADVFCRGVLVAEQFLASGRSSGRVRGSGNSNIHTDAGTAAAPLQRIVRLCGNWKRTVRPRQHAFRKCQWGRRRHGGNGRSLATRPARVGKKWQ